MVEESTIIIQATVKACMYPSMVCFEFLNTYFQLLWFIL